MAFTAAQRNLGPCLPYGSEGQESSHKPQINATPGKTHQYPSPCGNKQQLVPQGLKRFALLSGGPQKKSRPPSSWESMLLKVKFSKSLYAHRN